MSWHHTGASNAINVRLVLVLPQAHPPTCTIMRCHASAIITASITSPLALASPRRLWPHLHHMHNQCLVHARAGPFVCMHTRKCKGTSTTTFVLGCQSRKVGDPWSRTWHCFMLVTNFIYFHSDSKLPSRHSCFNTYSRSLIVSSSFMYIITLNSMLL